MSDSKKFIYIPIPKCASTSLDRYFRNNYDVFETNYQNLEKIQKEYLTFTFVRDPINRFISAYDTISSRALSDLKNKAFVTIKINEHSSDEKKLHRFSRFIDEVKISKWDEHILEQGFFIDGISFDYIGSIENSKKDFAELMQMLDCGNFTELLSHNKTKSKSCFYIDQRIISHKIINTICGLYKHDFDLISRYRKG